MRSNEWTHFGMFLVAAAAAALMAAASSSQTMVVNSHSLTINILWKSIFGAPSTLLRRCPPDPFIVQKRNVICVPAMPRRCRLPSAAVRAMRLLFRNALHRSIHTIFAICYTEEAWPGWTSIQNRHQTEKCVVAVFIFGLCERERVLLFFSSVPENRKGFSVHSSSSLVPSSVGCTTDAVSIRAICMHIRFSLFILCTRIESTVRFDADCITACVIWFSFVCVCVCTRTKATCVHMRETCTQMPPTISFSCRVEVASMLVCVCDCVRCGVRCCSFKLP